MSTPATASSASPRSGEAPPAPRAGVNLLRARRGFAAVGLALLAALPELAYHFGAQAARGPKENGDCAVLVLGFPTRADGSPHAIQRGRTAAGVAALRRFGCDRLVLSGGKAHTAFVEAETMAALARAAGVDAERLALETGSTSTEENIANSLPKLAGRARIVVVSDGLHAHRGLRYLCRQRPDLCPRACAYAENRPFELYFFKWAGCVIEAWSALRDLFG